MSAARAWPRLLRAPAVLATLIQCAAFPLTLVLTYAAASLLARAEGELRLGLAVAPWMVALLQGALAAGLSWRAGLAPWWRPIQLLFPLALLGALALQLPPPLFLAVFIVLLGLYWSTFRTQVPLYPSGPAVWAAVAGLLPPGRPLRLVDIGSGMGGMALDLARRRPESDVVGIELAPLPWLASWLRARLGGSRARFIRGDYEALDFADYDLVFAYLSPAAMGALWLKARAEMRPGSLLASYEFNIDACPPDRTIVTTEHGPLLYVWAF